MARSKMGRRGSVESPAAVPVQDRALPRAAGACSPAASGAVRQRPDATPQNNSCMEYRTWRYIGFSRVNRLFFIQTRASCSRKLALTFNCNVELI
jgi:hypothetical protein